MNSSSSEDFIFYLLLYIPSNMFFMVLAAILFSVINRFLNIHFPAWAVAIGAAVMVFVMMVAFLEGSTQRGTVGSTTDSTMFYVTTVIINGFVVFLMLALTGIRKLISSNPASTLFAFEKPQLITAGIYVLVTGIFALIPVMSAGEDYLNDIRSEKELQSLQEIIATDNIEDFTELYATTNELWKVTLPGEQRSLLEYLVAHDKTAMVHVLTGGNNYFFEYTFDWDIKSPAMLHMLINDGMNINKAVEELTAHNNTKLVKIAVEKYRPDFIISVSYIAKNTLRNNNIDLLDFLIEHGLGNDKSQSQETIYWLLESGDTKSAKLLIDRGFSLNSSDNRLVYFAIQHNDLSLLKFLFAYPFDVNAIYDGYTNLEHSIISGHDAIFDFLLTQKPEVVQLHHTKSEGEINALLMAEKYKRTNMVEKLKSYMATH